MDVGPGYWKEMVRDYRACVSFVDAQAGKLLRALEASPCAMFLLMQVAVGGQSAIGSASVALRCLNSLTNVSSPKIVHESLHETCTNGPDLVENVEREIADNTVKTGVL